MTREKTLKWKKYGTILEHIGKYILEKVPEKSWGNMKILLEIYSVKNDTMKKSVTGKYWKIYFGKNGKNNSCFTYNDGKNLKYIQ